jgi:hypothetical protein
MTPTPFTGVLCYEGTPSIDGRVIAAGALTWPDRALTLTDRNGIEPVGKVTRIWRDGVVIRCEGWHEEIQDDGLAIATKIRKYELSDSELLGLPESANPEDGPMFVLTDGEILSVAVTSEPTFLEARITPA